MRGIRKGKGKEVSGKYEGKVTEANEGKGKGRNKEKLLRKESKLSNWKRKMKDERNRNKIGKNGKE